MPAAVDIPSVAGFTALGMFTAQILVGLLLSVGYTSATRAYAAAAVFCAHGVLADPLLKNRPVDWIDAEKVYVEGCALVVLSATIWRIKYGRRSRRAAKAKAGPTTEREAFSRASRRSRRATSRWSG